MLVPFLSAWKHSPLATEFLFGCKDYKKQSEVNTSVSLLVISNVEKVQAGGDFIYGDHGRCL